MAGFDDRGRLYVAENAGVNLQRAELEKKLPNYVSRLEDTDGDGRFDKRTVFADKMTFPQGPSGTTARCTSPRAAAIWRFDDNDDDGVADDPRADRRQLRLHRQRGRRARLLPRSRRPHLLVRRAARARDHGRRRQADQQGEGGPHLLLPHGRQRRASPLRRRHGQPGRDRLDRRRGDARHRQHLLSQAGRLPRPLGARRRLSAARPAGVLAEFRRTGEPLDAVHDYGHVAVSGCCAYRVRAGVLPADERLRPTTVLVTEFNTHKVVTTTLSPRRPTFRAEVTDFLQAASDDFHPTDVLEDADGSLLVIDTGGWFRIGCPTSQIAKPNILGAIYRIRRTDAKKIDDPRGLAIDWHKLEPRPLSSSCWATPGPPSASERSHTLARQGDAAVPYLSRALASKTRPSAAMPSGRSPASARPKPKAASGCSAWPTKTPPSSPPPSIASAPRATQPTR